MFGKYITHISTTERIWWFKDGRYNWYHHLGRDEYVRVNWNIERIQGFKGKFIPYTINHALNANPNCPQQFPIIKEFLKDIVRGLHEIS